ncbi:MAG TPA: RNA 2'-phosphotransferase [Abditibacteriaceae bacterium]|jgi:putative RNA 2'-phosphotransferase
MEDKQRIRISKFLSKHLRHAPGDIGLQLADGGWVEVDALLHACAARGVRLNRDMLDEVVLTNDKKRFAFDEGGTRIRANQGHSIEVDLQLQTQTPPPILYHGTALRNVESILKSGIEKRNRHHVHLSEDTETAVKVGMRYGKPIVLQIDAAAMHNAGHLFFQSENGVWLTDEVPPIFISQT